MKYIDCKKYAQELLDDVKAVHDKKKLIIFTAGDDPASASYVKGKIKDCEYCGVPYEHITVQTPDELATLIQRKCMTATTGGIIIQLPLPEGWDEEYFTNLVPPSLDVDGFVAGSHFKPCTPEGIMYLLDKEVGDLEGKTVLLIGKGKLVGKPLIEMLLNRGCTLTIAHSKTEDLDNLMWRGHHDVTITAVGKPGLVNLSEVWSDVVIDAGITKNRFGKLCGDCWGENEWSKVTPVPGGVGLMTRAMLMRHMKGGDTDG
jgi:methylenetetrahydrofolate dehydrogenase (NADP+)/methenyltetrahydrofolate cyclohydrolase